MALLLTNNTAQDTLTAGGIIPLGTAKHGCGKNVRLNGNAITITGSGYYLVTVNASIAVSGTAAETIQLYENGTAIEGAVARETPTASGAIVNLTIPWIIRNPPCCQQTTRNLTVVSSVGGTLYNITVTVESI